MQRRGNSSYSNCAQCNIYPPTPGSLKKKFKPVKGNLTRKLKTNQNKKIQKLRRMYLQRFLSYSKVIKAWAQMGSARISSGEGFLSETLMGLGAKPISSCV